MREAERQREEAVTICSKYYSSEKNQAEKRLSKLDKSYVSEFEKQSYD